MQQDESWPDDYCYSPQFINELKIDTSRLPLAIGLRSSTTLTRAEITRMAEEEAAELLGWDFDQLRRDGFFGDVGINESTVDLVRRELQRMDPTGEFLQRFRTLVPPTLQRVPINSTVFPMLSPEQLGQMMQLEQRRFQQRLLMWQACNLIVSHEREEAKWEVEAAEIGKRIDRQGNTVRRQMEGLDLG